MRGFHPREQAGGDGGGLSKEAVMAAIARQNAQQAPKQPAQQPQEKSGIGALAADFIRNPGAILRDREKKAGLQNYADGGLVQRARGFFGGRKKQIDDAVAAAEGAPEQPPRQPAQAPAPQPAPRPQAPAGKFDSRRATRDNPAGISFADGGPVDEPSQEQRLRPRGFVVGAGGPTDDAIPANLSNGEYVLPADTVEAVGVEQLDALRAATHTPVAGEEEDAERMFFAGGSPGGVRDDEERRPISPTNIYPQGHPSAGANVYGGAGTELGSSGKFVQVPEGIGHQPGRQAAPAPVAPPAAPQPSMADQIPTGYNRPAATTAPPAASPAAPATASAATPPPAPPPDAAQIASDRAAFKAAGAGFMDGLDNTLRAAGDIAGLPVRAVTGAVDTAIIRPARAAGFDVPYLSPYMVPPGVDPASMTPFSDQKRLAAGQAAQAAPAPSAAPAAPAPAAQTAPAGTPAAARPNPTDQRLAAGTQAPPGVAAPAPRQVAPGVYEHGRGNYSDNAAGMGFAPGRTGQPSEQNMAAAAALAANYEQAAASQAARAQNTAAMRPGGGPVEPGSFTGGFSGVIGSDPRAGQRERERAEVMSRLMSPLTGDPRRDLTASQRNAMVQMLGQDSQERQSSARDAAGMAAAQLQAETQRYGHDSSARTADARNQLDGQRLGLDAQRYGVEAQAKGFDIRAAQRVEKLHEKYEAAKTPEEKNAIAQQIRDLSGKATNPKDDLMVVGGGQEWDSTANVMRNVPQRIFDARTRQYVDGRPAGNEAAGPAQPTSKAEYDALPKGAQYVKNGKIYTKG